jgi:hypothetical protein
VQNQRNNGQNQQQMDQSTRDMEHAEAHNPSYKQYDEQNREDAHETSFFYFVLPGCSTY